VGQLQPLGIDVVKDNAIGAAVRGGEPVTEMDRGIGVDGVDPSRAGASRDDAEESETGADVEDAVARTIARIAFA
jgi:hypothetical protein